MGNLWTEEQKQVIWLRNRNILVSAAAGFRKDSRSGRAYFAEDHGQGTSGGY